MKSEESQCFVVCCSVMQYVAVCCSVLQCDAVCCSVLQCAAVVCGSVLQQITCAGGERSHECVAVYCSVLQLCVAVRFSKLLAQEKEKLWVCRSVLQCDAV